MSKMSRCDGFVAALLLWHAVLLGWSAFAHSAMSDEMAHLVAGVSNWKLGQFGLYSVNPPLTRMIAAAPVIACRPNCDWKSYEIAPGLRKEWNVAWDFIRANPERWLEYLFAARCAISLFSVLAGYVCYRWACELYGEISGILAALLWCTSPTVLGWGYVVTPDAGAAALGVLAGYGFWRWLRSPGWGRACFAGLTLGLAELTKMTWVILFGLWPLLWLVLKFGHATGKDQPRVRIAEAQERRSATEQKAGRKRELCVAALIRCPSPVIRDCLARQAHSLQLGGILLLGLYVLNVGYGFEGSFEPLGRFLFVSDALSASPASRKGSNRFRGTLLEIVPVSVPRNYLAGLDAQKRSFERAMPSYLNGKWYDRGSWYYYLEALLLKEPLGTWALFLLACALTATEFFRRRGAEIPLTKADGIAEATDFLRGKDDQSHPSWVPPPEPVLFRGQDDVFLLAPAIAVLIIVSANPEVSYFRYLLPAYPFVFIWISKLGAYLETASPADALRASGRVQVSTAMNWATKTAIPNSRFRLSFDIRRLSFVIALAAWLIWSIVSSLSIFPHSLSYFNELAGGPLGGHRYLSDANIDWGQDLLFLKEWQGRHPDRPLRAALSTFVDPNLYGIEVVDPVPLGVPPEALATIDGVDPGPPPGWYALSVDLMRGRTQEYECFLRDFEPIETAGYSIYIYYLTAGRANGGRNAAEVHISD